MLLGYARVSTDQQDHALQLDALRIAGCEKVFVETGSGSRADRLELAKALEQARHGDVLVVWRLDRLARSLRHLIDIADDLKSARHRTEVDHRKHRHQHAIGPVPVQHPRCPGSDGARDHRRKNPRRASGCGKTRSAWWSACRAR